MRSKKVVWLVKMALLTALSLVLMYLVRFPIFPSAAYLEYDMADVPILIGTFMYGPAAGLLLTGVVSLLQWLLVSPQSGWVGALMHFLATGGFVLVAGFLYRKFHTRKGAALSLLLGGVGSFSCLAFVPYDSYTYSTQTGEAVAQFCPTPYYPAFTIDKATIGVPLVTPTCMCFDKEGNLYITDSSANRLLVLD